MFCVTFIAVLLAAGACGNKEEQPRPPPPPVDGIEIVKPGAEPRVRLRYKLAAGTTTALAMATDLDAKLADRDAKLPTLALDIDVAIASVAPDGSARVKLTVVGGKAISRGEADAPAMPVMARQAKQLTGMVATYTLSPSGAVKDSKIEESNRDLSQPMQEEAALLLQASEQVAMALPDQPLGVGGVWKHRRTMKQNQLTVVSVTTVEITAIAGDTVSFQSTLALSGPDQTLAQDGSGAAVSHIAGSGTQAGSLDLGKAVILGEIHASMGFEIGGEPPRATKLDAVWRITPRTEPAPTDAAP